MKVVSDRLCEIGVTVGVPKLVCIPLRLSVPESASEYELEETYCHVNPEGAAGRAAQLRPAMLREINKNTVPKFEVVIFC